MILGPHHVFEPWFDHVAKTQGLATFIVIKPVLIPGRPRTLVSPHVRTMVRTCGENQVPIIPIVVKLILGPPRVRTLVRPHPPTFWMASNSCPEIS